MFQSFSRAIVVSVILFSVCAVFANDSQTLWDQKRSDESTAIINGKREEIQAEIDGLSTLGKNQWAGKYYYGDGLGVNVSLDIAPEAGFAFEWHGCLGLYDRNWGPVTVQPDGSLKLKFHFENDREGFQGLSDTFIPVAWGERMYLIDPAQMINFCNQVNQGFEPYNGGRGMHLMKRGDHEKQVEGLPEVPEEFNKYFLAEPVEAQIESVDESTTHGRMVENTTRETPITLDAGSAAGLLPGMELYTIDQMYFYKAKVLSVEEDSCRAVVTQSWGANYKPEWNPVPEVGVRMSTIPSFSPRYSKKADSGG